MMRRCLGPLVLLAIVACARERVEVAEVEDPDATPSPAATNDADPPPFPIVDGGLDALPSCGPPPSIGRCANQCPNGYKSLDDGGPTCDCCP